MKIIFVILVIFIIKLTNATELNLDVYCPGEYRLIPNTKICILITQNATSHNNLCLSAGSTLTFYYLELILKRNVIIIDFLHTNNVTKFWLPIAKDEHNFLVWKLPMPLWNRNLVEMNEGTAPQKYANGECAMYETNIKHMFMDDCRNEYPHVCFYDTILPAVTHTGFCGTQLMGRISKFHGTCFDIEEFNANTTMNNSAAVADSYEKMFVINSFINKVGMDTMKILIAMNYTNATDNRVSIIQNGAINRANIDGVHYRLVENKFAHVVLNHKPSVDISYQAGSDTVVVVIKNFNNLWNPLPNEMPLTCHYDINMLNNTTPYNFNRINVSGATQFFSLTLPHYKGVGQLWCEAQMILTFETITSNRLVLKRNIDPSTIVLCVYLESDYCEMCSNIYSGLLRIREFTNNFTQEIHEFNDFTVYDVQLKNMITIDVNRTRYLFHVVLKTDEPQYVASYFKKELENVDLIGYRVADVRVNDLCSSSNLQYFPNVKLNEKSVIKTICLLDTGLPPMQECVGNLIDGAEWRQVFDIDELLTKKCIRNLVNDRTQELFNLNEMLRNLSRGSAADKNKTHDIVEKTLAFVNKTVTMEHHKITDMRYATETLHNLLETVHVDSFEEALYDNDTATNLTKHNTLIEPISEIIDTILDQETDSLIDNQNSKIMDTIDLMAEKIAESNVSTLKPGTSNTTAIDIDDDDDGVILIQKNNFIVMIVNPLIKNITGIALYKINEQIDEKSFHDFNVRKLHSNDTSHSIYNESLEITAHIPAESFDKIKINRNGELVPPNRIIFKIYFKNSLFNENFTDVETNGTTETIESESKVIGITIPNYYERELPPGIFTMFKTTKQTNWDDSKLGDDGLGCSDNSRATETRGWNRELWNYSSMGNSIVVCPVKRLANIGFVKLFGNKIVTDETSIIIIHMSHYTTIVGCTLSLFGLIVIFMTALIYDNWKTREATPLVLNVSTATFLQLTMFVVAELGIFKHQMDCLIIGGILHYVTLAGFFISLFVTNCQYRRYIIVFGSAKTKYFKTKILIIGWIVPLLIVTGCLLFTPNSYIPAKELHELGGICYPSDLILYLFVHAPIIFIFCINVCVYIWIIIRLTRENPNLRKTPKKAGVLLQIRLFFFIFFMLSLTWAFCLLAHYLESMAFAYLFNVTGPMQGFCLFIFCVVVDDKTWTFWIKLVFRSKN